MNFNESFLNDIPAIFCTALDSKFISNLNFMKNFHSLFKIPKLRNSVRYEKKRGHSSRLIQV